MLQTIERLESDHYISAEEARLAYAAEAEQIGQTTCGYEVEVCTSAAKDMPLLNGLDSRADWREIIAIANAAQPYGFNVGIDGMYELSSPVGHPLSLIVATRGLVRMGLLPRRTTGLVTDHQNYGVAVDGVTLQRDHRDAITRLARVLELRGNTTPKRLRSPIVAAEPKQGHIAKPGWNIRGVAGVHLQGIEDIEEDNKTHWEGDRSRIEFRTLALRSLEQFEQLQVDSFVLVEAKMAPYTSELARLYRDFDYWLCEFFHDKGLPATLGNLAYEPTNIRLLKEYIEPFAALLEQGSCQAAIQKTDQVIEHLREVFGLHVLTEQITTEVSER